MTKEFELEEKDYNLVKAALLYFSNDVVGVETEVKDLISYMETFSNLVQNERIRDNGRKEALASISSVNSQKGNKSVS